LDLDRALSTPIEPVELLWAWLREGWAYRVSQGWDGYARHGNDAYVAQINHEMKLVIEKEYASYFLMVSDIVRFAKDSQIPVGPGRGSSAASIVCYLLRITEVDPLDFPLTDFSRFVDPTREDLPDIDVDFDDERRHEVRAYAERKYGADYVGNIGTFTKYKGKSALKDVQRVWSASVPRHEIETLKGMIVERSGGDSRADAALMDTIEMFEGAAAIFAKYPKEIQIAIDLEGNYKSMSTHSAGLVITTRPITEITALYTREVKGREITAVAVDKYDAEYLNLMKMDLLGLTTMGMISIALRFAGMTLEELYRIPLDDPETLEAFYRNDVIGIFQFEGRATRLVGRDLKPDNFLELVDINALSRPGPLFSGTTAEYIDVKHGRREPTHVHPIIDEITKGTKGQIIYQEQILHALAQFGGLPVKRVHEIRRIISKKLGEAQFNTSAKDFAANAARLHGVSESLAMEVWSRVVTSASYAFVYSHSLAYTMIGYWCMWLKVHEPQAFYAAQLHKIKEEKWPKLIRDAIAHEIPVEGVDLRHSSATWQPTPDGRIVAGFQQLKGVGPSLCEKILEDRRSHGAFGSAKDLLRVKGIGPAVLAKITPAIEGDDPFGLMRTQIALDAVRAAISDRSIPIRTPTHNSEEILDAKADATIVWVGMIKLKEYKDVFEDERARTGDSLEDIKKRIKRPDLATSCVLHAYDDSGEDVYVRITRYDFPKFRTALEKIREHEDVLWTFARKSGGGFGASIYVKNLIVIDPSDDDDESDEDED
jgi:DNA polymerase-3 subunit alpha